MNIIYNLAIVTFSVSVWSMPQAQRVAHPQTSNTAIPIISQSGSVGADGSFNFTYETGNGIHVQEGGYLKKGEARLNDGSQSADGNDGDIQVIVGAFAYKSPDGTDIQLQYTADENGFHPVGAHLPTPPPIPPEIQRALTLLPQSDPHEAQQSNVNGPHQQFNQQTNSPFNF
ncbi:hypothetical protein RN001_008606 [Aquatica leii]|uniref:Uncharacterized protein n=1 Tax=Aquatica leii TaxID=1421715 RepID=A0AAN7Q597_9COLE|nr:hypothetical protein RN001_008606 [Aquatica leii]